MIADQGVRRALNEIGMMDDLVATGVAQPCKFKRSAVACDSRVYVDRLLVDIDASTAILMAETA